MAQNVQKKNATKKTPAGKSPAGKSSPAESAKSKPAAKKTAGATTGAASAKPAATAATKKSATVKKVAAGKGKPTAAKTTGAKKPAAAKAPDAKKSPAKAKAKPKAKKSAASKSGKSVTELLGANLPHIDKKILTQIIGKLTEMRDESVNVIQNYMQMDRKNREEGTDVGDDLDKASNEREREFSLLMHQRHLRRFAQIEEAFERIEEGSYGLCEGTEEPINSKRLLIMPLARFSLDYQQQQEKMLGRSPEDTFDAAPEDFSVEE